MAYAVLQAFSNTASAGNPAATPGSNLTTGSKLIYVTANASGSQYTGTVSDGAGHNFTTLDNSQSGSLGGGAWGVLDVVSAIGGTKPTFTASSSGTNGAALLILEVTGLATGTTLSACVDGGADGATSGSIGSPGNFSPTTPTYSSTVTNELLISVALTSGDNGDTIVTPPSGYSAAPNSANLNGHGESDIWLYYNNSTGGSETAGAGFTLNTPNGDTEWVQFLFAMKLASAAAPAPISSYNPGSAGRRRRLRQRQILPYPPPAGVSVPQPALPPTSPWWMKGFYRRKGSGAEQAGAPFVPTISQPKLPPTSPHQRVPYYIRKGAGKLLPGLFAPVIPQPTLPAADTPHQRVPYRPRPGRGVVYGGAPNTPDFPGAPLPVADAASRSRVPYWVRKGVGKLLPGLFAPALPQPALPPTSPHQRVPYYVRKGVGKILSGQWSAAPSVAPLPLQPIRANRARVPFWSRTGKGQAQRGAPIVPQIPQQALPETGKRPRLGYWYRSGVGKILPGQWSAAPAVAPLPAQPTRVNRARVPFWPRTGRGQAQRGAPVVPAIPQPQPLYGKRTRTGYYYHKGTGNVVYGQFTAQAIPAPLPAQPIRPNRARVPFWDRTGAGRFVRGLFAPVVPQPALPPTAPHQRKPYWLRRGVPATQAGAPVTPVIPAPALPPTAPRERTRYYYRPGSGNIVYGSFSATVPKPTRTGLTDSVINGILDSIISKAMASGRFDAVGQHEPKNSPGTGNYAAAWIQGLNPIRSSGQAATSGVLTVQFRVYQTFRSEPFDMIENNLLAATTWMLGQYSGTDNFNEIPINAVLDKIVSYCISTGRFDSVNQHEPKSGPGTGVKASVWVQDIRPALSSGLSSTSGTLTLHIRVYQSFLSQPFDLIDPNVLSAVADVMSSLSGDFNLGDEARAVDLLGMGLGGRAMSAQAGYVNIDKSMYRVMTITVPIIVNDMFDQDAANFQLGEDSVRHVDLLGAYGTPLSAQAGYVEIDRNTFRIMTINIPVVINDMFAQAG